MKHEGKTVTIPRLCCLCVLDLLRTSTQSPHVIRHSKQIVQIAVVCGVDCVVRQIQADDGEVHEGCDLRARAQHEAENK